MTKEPYVAPVLQKQEPLKDLTAFVDTYSGKDDKKGMDMKGL